jgi:transcriptional regulator GlxA family with amidase domain
VDFDGGSQHPLVRALPPMLALPLREVDGIDHSLALLFAETTQLRCGQRLLADRMFEVVILQLVRWILDHPTEAGVPRGLITGLAHPGIAAALTAVHEAPGQPWSLAAMADKALMSRSTFAAQFKEYVGQTPADYLAHWRIALAQSMFRNGVPVKQAAAQLGYQGAASLSRSFSQITGLSRRAWLQKEAAPPPAHPDQGRPPDSAARAAA